MSNDELCPIEGPALAQHQVLHRLRCTLEESHRDTVHRYSTRYPYRFEPHIERIDDFPTLDLASADDCCNKTVPLYICAEGYEINIRLLLMMLHNWLYRKWFRPYRSDIEYGQFIAKTILPQGISADISIEKKVDLIIALHRVVCQAIPEAHQKITEVDATTQVVDPWPIPGGIVHTRSLADLINDQEHFILQPTFQAIAIMVIGDGFRNDTMDAGQIQVYIVRAGLEDGLSAPVKFESILNNALSIIRDSNGTIKAVSTTLDTTYTFIQGLRDREAAVFGDRPEPIKLTEDFRSGYLTASLGILSRAKELGWEEPALQGPSSAWVDDSIYTEWTGLGADYDSSVMTWWEDHCRRI